MEQKLLIVSNNCLSKHNSNGRTLLNLLGDFSVSSLYQIYVSNEIPSEQYCQEYYRVTDKDVVKSYCKFRGQYTRFIDVQTVDSVPTGAVGKRKKTTLKSWLRDLAWKYCIFSKKSIISWVKEKKVDAVLLQAGDNVLLCDLALKISKKCKLPLIIYNTEDYYFKNYDYIRKKSGQGLFYKMYHAWFCKEFRKTVRRANNFVYNCDGLKELYDKTFQTSGHVIYTVTDFQPVKKRDENGVISYAGNLGCGRHSTLINVANSLHKIDNELYLDVYGPTSDQQVLDDFAKCDSIRYHGCVSYDEVCKVMKNSRLLVHVESFDEYYQRDTRYAFSTKLADYMASNIPIFLCAPKGNESYEYMKQNECAFLASDYESVENVLYSSLFDNNDREQKVNNALNVANKNHCYEKNGKSFSAIVKESIDH